MDSLQFRLIMLNYPFLFKFFNRFFLVEDFRVTNLKMSHFQMISHIGGLSLEDCLFMEKFFARKIIALV